MKLFSWNVNGIRAVLNKGEFQKFLTEYNPDILCLQETKAHRDQVELDLPQYHEFFNSATRKGYAGTAIFSKSKPLNVHYNIPDNIAGKYELADSYGNGNDEGRVTAAEFDNFWVVTVYTPNSKRDLTRLDYRANHWDDAFREYIMQLDAKKPVLVCGDFNAAHTAIDLARPKDNEKNAGFTEQERHGIDKLLDAGFVDVFRRDNPEKTDAYTWWTAWGGARQRNVGWRIDYWLANASIADKVKSPTIATDQMGSDHCPVGIEI